MIELTRDLARQVADFREDAPSADLLDQARIGFVDALGCAWAGSREPVALIAHDYARRRRIDGSRTCRLPWDPRPLPIAMAALALGTACHALDFDDVALAGHPSTVLVPAIFSEGTARHLSGQRLLAAYVIGYQVWAELFRREADPLHIKGWHPTAVYGTIAATASLAWLRGLDAEATTTALGVAASLASGLVANFGTMTKPLHAGRAAALAFDALELTEAGLGSAADVLEHRAGFMTAISPAGRVDRTSTLATDWLLGRYGLCIKQYPVCYSGHRAIDAVIDLANRHDLRLDQVRSVHVSLGPSQISMLRNSVPQTALEAKFSIQFAVAAAIDARAVSLLELTDDYVRRPALQAFYPRVDTATINEADPEDPTFSIHDEVRIELADGGRLASGPVRHARGHAANPLSEAQLRAKLEACLAHGLSPGLGARTSVTDGPDLARPVDRLLALGRCADVTTLCIDLDGVRS